MLDIKKFQKMSKDLESGMENMKDELAKKTVEGAAGGGAVKVVVNGNQELVSIEISPEAVDPDDIEMLQDLVRAAINQGRHPLQGHAAGKHQSAHPRHEAAQYAVLLRVPEGKTEGDFLTLAVVVVVVFPFRRIKNVHPDSFPSIG